MNTPCLETDRLLLRPIKKSDLQTAYVKWFTDPDVARYMFWGLHGNIGRTAEWIDFELQMIEVSDWYRFIICKKTAERSDIPCGSVLLYLDEEITDWEIAYHFEKERWGQGYASESVRNVLLFAKNKLKLTHVMARYAIDNEASGRVLRKTGFQRCRLIDYWCDDHRTRLDGWLCKCIL